MRQKLWLIQFWHQKKEIHTQPRSAPAARTSGVWPHSSCHPPESRGCFGNRHDSARQVKLSFVDDFLSVSPKSVFPPFIELWFTRTVLKSRCLIYMFWSSSSASSTQQVLETNMEQTRAPAACFGWGRTLPENRTHEGTSCRAELTPSRDSDHDLLF